MTTPRIRVVPGLALPFFPMRPAKGRVIGDPEKAVELFYQFREADDVIQPKLNGDRACVACVSLADLTVSDRAFFKPLIVGNLAVLSQNRHGGRFNHPVNNLGLFACATSCWDGEVWKGAFYPFECLVLGGVSYLRAGPDTRTQAARRFCRSKGIPWIFNRPDEKFLRDGKANLPFWEGFVRKRKGSPYVPCNTSNGTSENWLKYRWE